MRRQIAVAGLGVFLHLPLSFAQYQPIAPTPPIVNAPGSAYQLPPASLNPTAVPPGTPVLLSPPRGPTPATQMPVPQGQAPFTPTSPSGQFDVVLPFPEDRFAIDAGAVTMRRVGANWQVWAGQRMLKDLGQNEDAAKDVVRVLRELRPTEWCCIGSPQPVVEYGLTNGKPVLSGGFPRMVVGIELQSVRVEPIKGVWCLRDDSNILFNFGPRRGDAEQALAVVRKYGFNRIGTAGTPQAPAMAYFFATPEAESPQRLPGSGIPAALQEMSLTRTGIPVPGVGFVGEMVKFDPRRVEVRKDGFEWVVAHGADIFARFGPAEWQARDAARVIVDGRFTEFCRFGSSGLTFFLVNGKAPTKVPFAAQGRRFDLNSLKVHQLGDRWAVTENGRHLFDAISAEEGETLIRILKAYQFDQICQVGQSTRACLSFLAKAK